MVTITSCCFDFICSTKFQETSREEFTQRITAYLKALFINIFTEVVVDEVDAKYRQAMCNNV